MPLQTSEQIDRIDHLLGIAAAELIDKPTLERIGEIQAELRSLVPLCTKQDVIIEAKIKQLTPEIDSIILGLQGDSINRE